MAYYIKLEDNSAADLWADYYSPDLNLLWQKKLFGLDESVRYFDVAKKSMSDFMIAVKQKRSVKFYTFSSDGKLINTADYEGMISSSGFSLLPIDNIEVAVFEEGGLGKIDEFTIKTKVIALD